MLGRLKAEVRNARIRAHRVVNTELLRLYWTIGRTILEQQAAEGWGTKVIQRLAEDLRREFPDMTGLSRRNLLCMRQLAAAWPGEDFVQQPVAHLPWGHATVLRPLAGFTGSLGAGAGGVARHLAEPGMPEQVVPVGMDGEAGDHRKAEPAVRRLIAPEASRRLEKGDGARQ